MGEKHLKLKHKSLLKENMPTEWGEGKENIACLDYES